MKSAFLLQHLHVISEGNEDVKTIGVYATREDAIDAIARLSLQPGFSEFPKLIDLLEGDEKSGFYIDKYEIGKDHWVEGYVTIV